MNIYEKLLNIQTELKAPKGQENTFGHYKYRSCEDILEAVKPLLKENKVTLQLTDNIEFLGDRYYIKATARLIDTECELATIENTAYARESESKKGMEDSQITGTASSYARKYALNGLFCIDDTKDVDTDEFKKQQDKTTKNKDKQEEITEEELDMLVTQQQAKTIFAIMQQKGLNVEQQLQHNYGISNTKDLTKRQYASILNAIKNMPNKK